MGVREVLLRRLQVSKNVKIKRIPKSRKLTAKSIEKMGERIVSGRKSRNSTIADYPYRPHRSPMSAYRTPENKEGGIEPGE